VSSNERPTTQGARPTLLQLLHLANHVGRRAAQAVLQLVGQCNELGCDRHDLASTHAHEHSGESAPFSVWFSRSMASRSRVASVSDLPERRHAQWVWGTQTTGHCAPTW
jgi:hypothetical protein